MALAYGSCLWLLLMAMAYGNGLRQWLTAMAYGNGSRQLIYTLRCTMSLFLTSKIRKQGLLRADPILRMEHHQPLQKAPHLPIRRSHRQQPLHSSFSSTCWKVRRKGRQRRNPRPRVLRGGPRHPQLTQARPGASAWLAQLHPVRGQHPEVGECDILQPGVPDVQVLQGARRSEAEGVKGTVDGG